MFSGWSWNIYSTFLVWKSPGFPTSITEDDLSRLNVCILVEDDAMASQWRGWQHLGRSWISRENMLGQNGTIWLSHGDPVMHD